MGTTFTYDKDGNICRWFPKGEELAVHQHQLNEYESGMFTLPGHQQTLISDVKENHVLYKWANSRLYYDGVLVYNMDTRSPAESLVMRELAGVGRMSNKQRDAAIRFLLRTHFKI